MIYLVVAIVVICTIAQIMVVIWPYFLALIALWIIAIYVEGRLRRPSGRRQARDIEIARQQAASELGYLRSDAEAAMWEEFRRHEGRR